MVGFAFVDDVDIIQELPTEGDVIQAIQHEIDTWKFGLNTCSGDLVWDKCDIYIYCVIYGSHIQINGS